MSELIITSITGSGIPLPGDDIDTDQIVPARFLKEVTFEKMGDYLFYDNRFNEDQTEKTHPLNHPAYKGGSILVVGNNFGCGSSREHAPQAIKRYGIRAIVGISFAEIFAGNCKALGIPAVTVSRDTAAELTSLIQQAPHTQFELCLERNTLKYNGVSIPVELNESRRQSFLTGSWDAAAMLSLNDALIKEKAASLPYLNF